MKSNTEITETDPVYKEVVVIGNGPSGIMVSLMLSGRLPYLVSTDHPDEMLSARLRTLNSQCLISSDLEFLAQGLEGRCSNPISLLMDALLHPCADLGVDLEPLVEFRAIGKEIDHVVIGVGPPGGSWHRIDPDVLTLSLGNWMSLPDVPFPQCAPANEKRAFSRDVAAYYERYASLMGLTKYFRNDTVATAASKVNENVLLDDDDDDDNRSHKKKNKKSVSIEEEEEEEKEVVDRCELKRLKKDSERSKNRTTNKDWFVYEDCVEDDGIGRCFLSNAIHCLMAKGVRRARQCKRPPKSVCPESVVKRLHQNKSEPIIVPKHERKRSISCCGCNNSTTTSSSTVNVTSKSLQHSRSLDSTSFQFVPATKRDHCDDSSTNVPKWIVETVDRTTGRTTRFSCKYLVLACGTYDRPNRLEVFRKERDPDWLVHDLRSLETKLDETIGQETDPVVIVGAGLSAADAVMAVRSRNVPVIHVFRGKSAEFTRQLPENMYPEYHKVRQMMNDGGSTYPLYKAYPEHSIVDLDCDNRTVVLRSNFGEQLKVQVSFAAVLIGSRPDLSFLPKHMSLAVFPDKDIDSKTNPVNVDRNTHEVVGQNGLFAVGPLAGDNFVRYIAGGAVAVVREIYKKLNLI